MDKKALVQIWQDAFEDYPYDIVHQAIKDFIIHDERRYPPTIGQIAKLMRENPESQCMLDTRTIEYIRQLTAQCANCD